jgi:hypothetical protein
MDGGEREGGACAIIYVQLFGEPSCETVWPAMCRLKSIWTECVPSEVEKKKKVVFLLYFLLGDMDYSAKRPKQEFALKRRSERFCGLLETSNTVSSFPGMGTCADSTYI